MLSLSLSEVVAEKYAATQQDPYVTIASDGQMYASMTLFQNEEVQISVQELARDRVKRDLQTDLLFLSRNARRSRVIIYRMLETLPHLG